MFSLIFYRLSFLIALNMYSLNVVASDDLKDDSIDRGARGDRTSMWFGPRLGKRSLRLSSDSDRQTYRLLEAADALKYYYDQLPYYEAQADEPETKVTKKVIFTPKLGRRSNNLFDEKRTYDVDFTPRLGRRLADELTVTPADDVYRQDPEQIDSRSKYFSPRLGRTTNFSPRLGRELSYDIYPNKIRLVRSANNTKST